MLLSALLKSSSPLGVTAKNHWIYCFAFTFSTGNTAIRQVDASSIYDSIDIITAACVPLFATIVIIPSNLINFTLFRGTLKRYLCFKVSSTIFSALTGGPMSI